MNEQPTSSDLNIEQIDPTLYNDDLAPLKPQHRTWGSFEIFNVWSNDIQSLFGYTLAASLFLTYGLNGWAVMAAIILAGVIVMFLVIVPALSGLDGFGWLIGAGLGGVFYYGLMKQFKAAPTLAEQRAH